MLRLFLPPNLAAAAGRDAIPVKLELDLAAAPPAELLPALAFLSRWIGAEKAPVAKAGVPHRVFLQLSRAQLRDLIGALRGQAVFAWTDRPGVALEWWEKRLEGVSEFLEEPKAQDAEKSALAAPRSRPEVATHLGTAAIIDGSEHFLAVTLPSREHFSYAKVLDLLKTHGFLAEPSNGRWWLRDRHKTLNFLAAYRERLRGEFAVRPTDNFLKNTAKLIPAEIVCAATEAGGGFDVTLSLRAGSADENAIRSALMSGRGYLENGGEVVLLDAEKLQRLGKAQGALLGTPDSPVASRAQRRLSAARAVGLESVLEELAPGFQPPATWKARSSALRNLSQLAPAPVPEPLAGQLRPYQRLGAAWLWHLHRHQLGGILADEMGLGKTLQALALLAACGRGPSLVVCPASLLENWRREAARFMPQLKVFVHHGEHRLAVGAAAAAWDLIITSYGTLVRDEAMFAGLRFECIVGDEAQHIKNRRSQNARILRSLHASGRFLLTGTPLENSLDDLRSLFDFLLPGYLEPAPAGLRGEERAWHDRRLREQVAPYLLRRTKAAVASELPAKLEQIVWCEMAPAQASLYRAFQEKAERELDALAGSGAGEGQVRLAVFTQLLRLRQICCDPRLVEARAEIDSAKLEAFRELMAEAVDDGHRLLVFSQFTSLLALLRQELESQGLAYCYLDGSMTPRSRQAEVDRFQASDKIPVFLLSLKAGGTGLNLTGADTVVHFDPWWNPAVEMQATDRAHRIGQTRVVTSYKLIAAGSVEEKVLGLQAAKRALLADVLEASDAVSANLSLADLKDLLK